jgi:hypothetical protein
MSATSPPILALVRDLMFSSRISAEARAAGVVLKIIRDPAALEKEPQDSRLLIVDMNLDNAIPAAGAWRTRTGGTVIGFVAHTDADAISQGKSKGFDQVMPRSKFVTLLPQLLRNPPIVSGGA